MKTFLVAMLFVLSLSMAPFSVAAPDDEKQPATEPSSQPSLVDVSDKAAIDAAMGKDVELEGVVKSADWSSSGKVLIIKFEKADESNVSAVLFQEKREAMDKAFSGDIGKALTGAHVRLKGKLKDFKGKPEIVVSMPSQVTIVEAGK